MSDEVTLFDLVLDRVREVLSEDYPDSEFTCEIREDSFIIIPRGEESFEVSVYREGHEVIVAAGRWHAHEDDLEQASACVLWLLGPYYRLIEEYKGSKVIAAWIERFESTGWEMFDPVYFLNPDHPADWKPLGDEVFTRRILQQRVIQPDEYPFVPPNMLTPEGYPVGSVFGTSVETSNSSKALEDYEVTYKDPSD
ncbi:MAG TPA: hypothetical protein PLO61_06855 [Fimbriimonadaceae bacterium]|nr:hypothetical protein [Fimbriimonadaceae bacterium]HRJ33188.1 hypothetical protein [Fimbriimonadaceae bacterium]